MLCLICSVCLQRLLTVFFGFYSFSCFDGFDVSGTDAPINGNTFPSVNERSQLNISITIGVETKNSSDLSSGGPPMSESDEFFVSTPIVIEIWAPQLFTFSKEAYHLSEHQSAPVSYFPPPSLSVLPERTGTFIRLDDHTYLRRACAPRSNGPYRIGHLPNIALV